MNQVTESADSRPILSIRNLKTYFYIDRKEIRAVDGVDLDLKATSTLGLVGESGCGKTITLMSIMRLIQSPPGRIMEGTIDYRPIGSEEAVDVVQLQTNGEEMRRIRGAEIAMIFQEPMNSLNPLFTVGNQIAEAVQFHEQVSRRAALNRALEMLYAVNINDPKQRLRDYPHQLSGGMRQRVMIAIALACNPAILLADEPTTALDVTVQAQILDLMQKLQDAFGSAIMLITHNLGVVSQTVDHVAVMYLGRIVEYADVRIVFHRPLHPYTRGLLSSVPVFGRRKERALVPIEGMVPTPTDHIVGCSFAPRCPIARERCSQESPELDEWESDHHVACFYCG